METVCVGIDTSGTFTDLVAVELERGRHHYHKVPTLTGDPAKRASSNCSTGNGHRPRRCQFAGLRWQR